MPTLQIVFVALASGLILFWLIFALFGPRKVDLPGVLVVLRYGSTLRVLALILAWMPPALMIYAIWSFFWRNDTVLVTAGVSFLTTSVIAGLFLIEVERTQIALSDEGIARDSPWKGRSLLKWDEIERVQYSALNRWLVLQGAGKSIRASLHLIGIGELVRMARSKLPAERYASAAAAFDAITKA